MKPLMEADSNAILNQPQFEDAMARVAAIIVTYGDRGSLCSRALDTAAASGVAKAVVVANGLTKRSLRLLRAHAAGISMDIAFVVGSNGGSAAGFGYGLLEANRRWRPRYFWLLDDDNRPSVDALTIQIQIAETLRTLGISAAVLALRPAIKHHANIAISPDCLHYPGSSSFMYFDLFTRIMQPRHKRGARQPIYELVAGMRTIPVPYGPYGGLLISDASVSKIGLPDGRFVLYEDDTEYLDRLTLVGHPLLLSPDAVVLDELPNWLQSDSPDEGSGIHRLLNSHSYPKLYYSTRNRVYFDLRRPASNRVRLSINALAYCLAVLLSARNLRHLKALRVIFCGIRDGILGRLGPHEGYPLTEP